MSHNLLSRHDGALLREVLARFPTSWPPHYLGRHGSCTRWSRSCIAGYRLLHSLVRHLLRLHSWSLLGDGRPGHAVHPHVHVRGHHTRGYHPVGHHLLLRNVWFARTGVHLVSVRVRTCLDRGLKLKLQR